MGHPAGGAPCRSAKSKPASRPRAAATHCTQNAGHGSLQGGCQGGLRFLFCLGRGPQGVPGGGEPREQNLRPRAARAPAVAPVVLRHCATARRISAVSPAVRPLGVPQSHRHVGAHLGGRWGTVW